MTHEAPRILNAAIASLGVCGLILCTGCYTYAAKAPSDLVAGQHVEVTVNNLGRVVLAADLGEDVARLEGDVVALTDSTLRVSVTDVSYVSGTSSAYPGSEINVPRNTITNVSTKQFSRSKTTVLAVGLVAALIAAIGAAGLAGIGGSSSDPKPGTGTGVQ